MHWLRDVLSEIRQSAEYNNRMTHQVVNCSRKLFSLCCFFINASVVVVVSISSISDLFVLLTVHGIHSNLLVCSQSKNPTFRRTTPWKTCTDVYDWSNAFPLGFTVGPTVTFLHGDERYRNV